MLSSGTFIAINVFGDVLEPQIIGYKWTRRDFTTVEEPILDGKQTSGPQYYKERWKFSSFIKHIFIYIIYDNPTQGSLDLCSSTSITDTLPRESLDLVPSRESLKGREPSGRSSRRSSGRSRYGPYPPINQTIGRTSYDKALRRATKRLSYPTFVLPKSYTMVDV